MLRANKLSAFYDRTQVLHEIDLRIEEGEIVGLVGANGAGKSTTLLGIIGINTRTEGEIWLNEERIDGLPAYERVRRAIVLIPERRRLFPFMSVLENLELGTYLPGRAAIATPASKWFSICCPSLPSGVTRSRGRSAAESSRCAPSAGR